MLDSRPLVAVVDDDPGMNQAIQRLLQAAGFGVVAFPSAEALVDSGQAKAAVCFVFDIQLQNGTGFDLYRQLTGRGIHRPVIFITAYDDPRARGHATEMGAAAYFTKPFSGRELVESITGAIRSGPGGDGKPTTS